MCRTDNDGHREIAVPSLQYDGVNDRAALGTPEAMILYGLRGLRLRAFVAAGGLPSAEPYLLRFLCENRVTMYIAPWTVRRIRVSGQIERRDAGKDYLDKAFDANVDVWKRVAKRLREKQQHQQLQGGSDVDFYTHPTHANCLPRAIWAL
jgi:hypothetical protein